jgi:hypothetical protein
MTRRTPIGWTVRRGDMANHPLPAGDWRHGDDCADRWYADRDGEPIDHRGPGRPTRAEAIEVAQMVAISRYEPEAAAYELDTRAPRGDAA